MAGERTYPILPCADLAGAVTFYEVLGFVRSYVQLRPNPYAVVALEDIEVHLAAHPGHDPATSVSSVIVTVPDAEASYRAFAERLRDHYGRLPSAGIPRVLRPRRKQGTATGFSLVDVGGNWLRFYRAGEPEEDEAPGTGLARVVEVAARQGDARGDDTQALAVLDRGLARHPGSSAADRARALLYRAELLVRLGRDDEARRTFTSAVDLVPAADADVLREDVEHARDVLGRVAGERN